MKNCMNQSGATRVVMIAISLVALSSITLSQVFADTTTTTTPAGAAPAATAATTSTVTAAPTLSSRLGVSYLGAVNGPILSNPMATTTDVAKESPVSVNHSIGASYKFNNGMSLGPVANFDTNVFQGMTFKLNDPWLKFGIGKEFASGPFSLGGDLRYYVPVTEASRARNSLGALRTTQVASIEIPGSIFSIDLAAIPYVYFYSTIPDGKRLFRFIGAPTLNAKISDTFSANVGYWFDSSVKSKAGGTNTGLVVDDQAVDLGFGWDVTPNFNLAPFVEMNTNAALSLDTTNVQMYITWKVL